MGNHESPPPIKSFFSLMKLHTNAEQVILQNWNKTDPGLNHTLLQNLKNLSLNACVEQSI